jgi:hypothetical protein
MRLSRTPAAERALPDDCVANTHPDETERVVSIGARRLGIAARPHRLRLGSRDVFRVGDVVARVSSDLLGREEQRAAADAQALHALGAPIVAPISVMNIDRRVISFWPWLGSTPAAPGALGDAIRQLGAIRAPARLRSWDGMTSPWRRLTRPPRDPDESHLRSEVASVVAAAAVACRDVSWGPAGVIHGDAHAQNARVVDEQAVLVDPDTLAHGPLAIDLAPAVIGAEQFGDELALLDEFLHAAEAHRVPQPAIQTAVAARIADVLSWLYAISPYNITARHELHRRLTGEHPWHRI